MTMAKNDATVTDAPVTDAPVTEEAPKITADELSEDIQAMLSILVKRTNALNEVRRNLRALSSDPAEIAKAILDGEDEPFVSLRARIAELTAELDKVTTEAKEKADALAAERANADVNKDEVNALTEKETSAAKLVRNLTVSLMEAASEENVDITHLLPTVESKSGRSSTVKASGGNATGVRRPRGFDVKVDGTLATAKNNNNELVSSFSAAAKVAGVSTPEITAPYYERYGDDAAKWPVGEDFTYEITNGKGETHTITATKRGDDK